MSTLYFYLAVRKPIDNPFLDWEQRKIDLERERIFADFIKFFDSLYIKLYSSDVVKPSVAVLKFDSAELSGLDFKLEEALSKKLPNNLIVKLGLEFNVDENEDYNVQVDDWVDFFEERIGLVFTSLSLSHPDGYSFVVRDIVVDDRLYMNNGTLSENEENGLHYDFKPIEFKCSFHIYLNASGFYFKWPRIKQLSHKKAWDWMNLHLGSIDGLSSNRIENALNCYTMLFDSTTEMEYLLWSVAGVEALYVRGETGIAEQIHKKVGLLFGYPSDFNKILKKVYNFRSRFIHGDMPIPSRFSRSTIIAEEKFDDELFKSTSIMISILVVTLQFLITKGIQEFEFEYKLIKK